MDKFFSIRMSVCFLFAFVGVGIGIGIDSLTLCRVRMEQLGTSVKCEKKIAVEAANFKS